MSAKVWDELVINLFSELGSRFSGVNCDELDSAALGRLLFCPVERSDAWNFRLSA